METQDERRRSGSNPHAVQILSWNMGRKHGWSCICGAAHDKSFTTIVEATTDSVKHQKPVPTKTLTVTTWFTVEVPADTDTGAVSFNIRNVNENAEIVVLDKGAYSPLEGAKVLTYETINVEEDIA